MKTSVVNLVVFILVLVFAAPQAHAANDARQKIRGWAKRMEGSSTGVKVVRPKKTKNEAVSST